MIPFARNAKLKVLDLGTEIVLGASLHLTQQYEQLWREYMKKNGEKFSKYLEEDIPAAVEEQLLWLSDIGFVDVGCHWRYLNFAIFGGKKPEA